MCWWAEAASIDSWLGLTFLKPLPRAKHHNVELADPDLKEQQRAPKV